MGFEYCILHKHPLALRERIREGETICVHWRNCGWGQCKFYKFKCFACQTDASRSGSLYFCEFCEPYNSPVFHKSCAELGEEIQLSSHPHGSLHIKKHSTSSNLLHCHYCYQEQEGYKFCCDQCSFQICYRCAARLVKYHEGREHTEHFSHRHPLILSKVGTPSKVGSENCKLCIKKINGLSYGCTPCLFYIHKSCYELPQEIHHPLHPRHFLSLQKTGRSWCDACGFKIQGFGYRCDECNFDSHLECVSLTPSIKCEAHEHPLTLVKVPVSYKSVCGACGFEMKGDSFVRCLACNIEFHVQCGLDSASLPPNIVHEHHQHPLTFANKLVENDFALRHCGACKEEVNSEHPFYYCVACEYHSHARCIITKVQLEKKEKLRHFSHRHFLFPLKNKRNENIICDACLKGVQDDSAYGCEPCSYYLHKSCTELPKVINHCFHRHSLTLTFNGEYLCDACGRRVGGFVYHCRICDFDLDLECASLQPSIKLECHRHNLAFFGKLDDSRICLAGCGVFKDDASFLCCFRCRFSVHLFCAPLPEIIKLTSHQHYLTLSKRDTWECVYHCEECHLEVYAKHAIPEVILSLKGETLYKAIDEGTRKGEGEREMEVRHCDLHKHPLTLYEKNSEGNLFCPGCSNPFLDQSYNCEQCEFYPGRCFACNTAPSGSFYVCKQCWPQSPLFHKSCAELPQRIKISFHPHSSFYFEGEFSSYYIKDCDFCNRRYGSYKFTCDECAFQIDFECVAKLIKYHEGREHIKHFSHRHPLTSLKLDGVNCKICNKNIDGPTYGCAPCEFLIHYSCREFPQTIQHHFHPLHFLTLEEIQGKKMCCACGFNVEGFGYHCKKCHFILHLDCVSRKSNIKYEGHEHLLTLLENIPNTSTCQACSFDILGTFCARCIQCDINFHVQCGPNSSSLPQNVVYEHHQHPLALIEKLVNNNSALCYCDICKEEMNTEHPYYGCVECEYYAHAHCVITEVQLEEREKLRHFSHRHFLLLRNNKRNDEIICYACKRDIQDDPAYGCETCKYYLHKSCAELPRRILHPSHRHHLCLRRTYVAVDRRCSACHKHCNGFTFRCDKCNFTLDLDCISLQPSIKLGHKHILTLIEKLHDTPICRVCKLTTSPNASYLCCVECNLNVHLLCSPLPQTIEHWSHQHLLSLKDNFVEHSCDDEYCCDICEIKRYNGECVYYCAECSFVIDFDCAFSEVVLALQKEPRDVQLRTVINYLSFEEIMESCTMEEDMIMNKLLRDVHEEMEGCRETSSKAGDEVNVSILEISVFSNEDFLRLMTRFTAKDTVQLIESEDTRSKLSHVGDYKIIRKLAPVLQNLLDKYGDIGDSCTLNQKQKTILLVKFCATMHSMMNTKIMNITDELIFTWWYNSKLLDRAGFRINFVFDHLKKIAQARYGTGTDTHQHGSFYKLLEEMVQMDQLAEEIDKISQEIDKRRSKVDALKKQKQEMAQLSERSRLEVERLSEALEFKKKNAATGLL